MVKKKKSESFVSLFETWLKGLLVLICAGVLAYLIIHLFVFIFISLFVLCILGLIVFLPLFLGEIFLGSD